MEDIVNIHKIPNPQEAEKMIRRLAQKGDISWSKHLWKECSNEASQHRRFLTVY